MFNRSESDSEMAGPFLLEQPMPERRNRQLKRRQATLVLAFIVAATITSDSTAQKRPRSRPDRPGQVSAAQPARLGDVVTISYPDSVSLAAFVDYVSQTLELKIIYGDELRSQSVVFRPGNVEVPRAQLLDLLRSMLRIRDLALVEGDVGGWLRIVQTNDMQRYIAQIRDYPAEPELEKSNRVVSQVIRVAGADMQNIVKLARSFLSSPKASVIEIPDRNLIIITDYESAIGKALEIIRLVDVTPTPVQIVSVPLRYQDANTVTQLVITILNEKAKLEQSAVPRVFLQPDPEAASILLIGSEQSIASARELINRFDVPASVHTTTVTYTPRYVTADRLLRLIESVIADESLQQKGVKTYLDEEANRLYVTAPGDLHEKIEDFLELEDVKAVEPSRPLRIYRPENRLARDLISTLADVLPAVTTSTLREAGVAKRDGKQRALPGPNRPPEPPGPGQAPPLPPAYELTEAPPPDSERVVRVEGEDFVLSYDEHTNAIIAIGPREFHTKLEALLEELDHRRPQVLIEMTLVAITFNDSLSLAIELANEEKLGDYLSLFFSSFGLSDIDLTTGQRTFNPGGGLNGAIIGPNETPFLMRAIAAHGNSRVITTPKAIVSDNTTASIASVEEAPFTSINASDTVATTSFAGFESAGTTLKVTPHIAQGNHLSLDYSLNFSNFTGGGSAGVPPPRTTNTFSGSVEIPDGHTIIVGGLVTENEVDAVTEVPLLGRIPIIGTIFQSSDRARAKSRIYAFIRVAILRDDHFADLKLISQREVERAALANRDYPSSEYQWMR